MPAALVELFFVSNRRDARALRQRAVRTAIVKGLFQGVKDYADGLRKTRCR
jgi:N-acetylmuramoyl-L-alanine amidase